MPIYEYRCEACGHLLDALQKISDEPLRDCPNCNEASLKRLISAPAFRLKGSGWYETDFKSEKEKKRNLAESAGEGGKSEKADGKPDGKSEAGSDTKAAAKSESKSESKDGAKSKPASDKKPSKGSGTEAA